MRRGERAVCDPAVLHGSCCCLMAGVQHLWYCMLVILCVTQRPPLASDPEAEAGSLVASVGSARSSFYDGYVKALLSAAPGAAATLQ